MTTRVRSFSLDLTKSASPQVDAARLWLAFGQAARISTRPALDLLSWADCGADALNRALPDVEGEPPVEIVTTDRSRVGCFDVEREVRIHGPRRPLDFSATFARQGAVQRGALPEVELLPPWTLVSASVDFGPAGSLDRAWAVLELFAGWEPEVASGWEMDEIADALSEVPELSVAFVHDDGESGPSLSYAERLLLDHLLAPVRAELQQTEGQSLMVNCRDEVELALDAVWRALPFAEIEALGIEIPDRHLRADDPARLCAEILDIGRAMALARKE